MLDLGKTPLLLEDGMRASPIAKGGYDKARPGCIVGITEVRAPEDLHPSIWERHPEGDEILHLIEGAVRLIVAGAGGLETYELGKGDGFLVPRGAWHRFETLGPCDLLFITPGPTEKRPVEG